jgi:hypothetical protein
MKKYLVIFYCVFGFIQLNAQNVNLVIGRRFLIPTVEGVVRDLHTNTYDAFPWPEHFENGIIASIIKESETHAAAGYILFGTSNGGLDYNYHKIVCEGDTVIGANLGLFIDTTTDRAIIDFQASDAGPIKFIYSDDRGITWHYASSTFTYPPNYSSAEFGKIIKLSGGRLLKFYYCIPINATDTSINGCLKSDDNGLTWASFSIVCRRPPRGLGESGNDAIINGDGWLSEIYADVIGVGTSNNDTLVALIRDEQISGGSFIHYFSTNGGTSWSRVSGTGSIFTSFSDYATVVDAFPVSIQRANDSFYIVAGARWTGNYKIAYVTNTAANFINNTTYSSVTVLPYDANADVNAASNDFGYPICVWRYVPLLGINEMLIQFYDSSPTSSGFPRDMMIYQIKITF